MKKSFLSFFLLLIIGNCFGQDPNWTVNPNNYQHNMTFTTFLNVNGTTLSSSNDKVAAFVNNEVRGIANVVYVASRNKYVAYLSVFANTNGETIQFKIYDSINDEVVDISTTETFEIDGTVGGIFQSFSVANPELNNEANLNSFEFTNVTEKSVSISGNKIEVFLPVGSSLTSLTPSFTVSNGATVFVKNTKQTSGVTAQDFTNSVFFTVLSQDETVAEEYEVNVSLEIVVSDLTVSLTSITSSLIKENPVEFTVQTNQPIVELLRDNFLLTNAVIQSITTVDASNYTVKLVAMQHGSLSVEIASNSVKTLNNNGNTASNKLSFVYDTVAPVLYSIKRKTPTEEITNVNTLEFTVVFSEAVNSVTENDFESVVNASISLLKINDFTYVVSVKNIDNYNGAISISLKNTNSIADKAGNLLRVSSIKNYKN